MTTLPPNIDAGRIARQSDVQKATSAPCGTTADDLPDQYAMARQQYVSFTPQEAYLINQTLDLIEACTNKCVSPNKLVKQAALQKARQVLNQGEK